VEVRRTPPTFVGGVLAGHFTQHALPLPQQVFTVVQHAGALPQQVPQSSPQQEAQSSAHAGQAAHADWVATFAPQQAEQSMAQAGQLSQPFAQPSQATAQQAGKLASGLA